MPILATCPNMVAITCCMLSDLFIKHHILCYLVDYNDPLVTQLEVGRVVTLQTERETQRVLSTTRQHFGEFLCLHPPNAFGTRESRLFRSGLQDIHNTVYKLSIVCGDSKE